MNLFARMRVNCVERTVAGLDWLARARGRGRTQPAHLQVGLDGEEAVYFYLRRKGYEVVAKRWSGGNVPGDVDLIARQGLLVCFVEVKTRSTRDFLPAEAAVDKHKRDTLRRLARRYVRQLPQEMPPDVRFDVVSVYLESSEPEIVHFENAFGWSERRQRN
jgi:putative endonuclease